MRSFSVLIKPASSLCNLRCGYCFYADVSQQREVPSYGMMSTDTAHKLIDRAFGVCPSGIVSFSFQGGEPTLAGLDFYRDFTGYAESVRPGGVSVRYSIQTNGVLLDDGWCDLFAAHSFLVGLSLDGDESIHDLYRKKADASGSYRDVLRAAKLLNARKVDFNVLSVVTRQSARHPSALLAFCKKKGFSYLQPIPCLAPLDGSPESDTSSLTPELYASFLTGLWAVWEREFRAGNYISVRQFDDLVRVAGGGAPGTCGMSGVCAAQYVVEADGSVYPCDFYVLDRHRCGNIRDDGFDAIRESEPMKRFLRRDPPDARCVSCEFYPLCGGGCRRFRSLYFKPDGGCAQKEYLGVCYPSAKRLAEELRRR